MPRSRLLLLAAVTFSFVSANAQGVPFTREGLATIKGKDICTFKGKFYSKLGVYLDGKKESSVEYLDRDGTIALFLLGRPPSDNCGIVEAVLDLTPLIKKGESPEFNCYTQHEGGTTWEKWGHVIGLADNQRGKRRFVKARLAWRVNIKEKRFEKIQDEAVQCDTAGYED